MARLAMTRVPVTQSEFARYLDEGGYRRRERWCEEGWDWRVSAGVSAVGCLHLIRNTWRYFNRPNRRIVWTGFRTCAL